MKKKIGTVIAVTLNNKTGIYLGENGALTTNISHAKTFRATAKVLDTIRGQVVTDFPKAQVSTSLIERWEVQ